MELTVILGQLRDRGLHPVLVDELQTRPTASLVVRGELSDFIAAVEATGERVVFVDRYTLDEDDFVHPASLGTDGSEADIPLATINPGIERFRAHVGADGFVELFSLYQGRRLEFMVRAEWWPEFAELRAEAAEQIREGTSATVRREKERLEAAHRELVAKARSLAKNPQFATYALGKDVTQRGLVILAKEIEPELEELDPNVLKAEIAEAQDRIKARRLLGRDGTR